MSIICVRGGHNYQSTGASALINEVVEDRKIKDAITKYLRQDGVTTVDATPGNCTQSVDLRLGTDTANKAKAELFVPVHFNAAFKSYVGAIGIEVFVNSKNYKGVQVGTRIVNALGDLGFKNRGVKDGMVTKRLHDIRQSNMPAVLVEVCFVEATEDVKLYKQLGPDKMGKVLAEAILGHKIKEVVEPNTKAQVPAPVIIPVPTTRVNNSVAQLQTELNKHGSKLLVDGFYGPKTLKACPTLRVGAKGNITKWLQKRLALKLQDGDFGPLTLNAVKNYQTALKLKSDGVVGEKTWAALLR